MVVSSGINPIGSNQNGGWLTGICITDGTKIITFDVNHYQSTPNPPQIDVIQWTNATTYDDTSYGGNPLQNVPPVLWLKIHDDATNRTYWTSQDPTNAGWVELATESDTAFLTPVSGGIFMDPYNTAQGSAAEFMSDLFVSFQLLDS
jgi:hypothetical protein